MATAVAEALKYLHNECYPHVIHRDVKSSNILLSDDFQPQVPFFPLISSFINVNSGIQHIVLYENSSEATFQDPITRLRKDELEMK